MKLTKNVLERIARSFENKAERTVMYVTSDNQVFGQADHAFGQASNLRHASKSGEVQTVTREACAAALAEIAASGAASVEVDMEKASSSLGEAQDDSAAKTGGEPAVPAAPLTALEIAQAELVAAEAALGKLPKNASKAKRELAEAAVVAAVANVEALTESAA